MLVGREGQRASVCQGPERRLRVQGQDLHAQVGDWAVKGRRASSEASVDLAEALVQAEMAQLT